MKQPKPELWQITIHEIFDNKYRAGINASFSVQIDSSRTVKDLLEACRRHPQNPQPDRITVGALSPFDPARMGRYDQETRRFVPDRAGKPNCAWKGTEAEGTPLDQTGLCDGAVLAIWKTQES